MVLQKTEVVEAFKTSDLQLTAYLMYCGFEFISPPAVERGLTIFTFEKTMDLIQAVADFQTRSTTVDALTLFERLRIVKAHVWTLRNKHRVIPEVVDNG